MENFSEIQTHYKLELTLLHIDSMKSQYKLHVVNRRI